MEEGRIEKPTKVLARMQKIRRMGAIMHHNMGIHYMTDNQFNQAYWQIFPAVMTDWLTNDQNVDPHDVANPLDAAEIGDHMQRYWNLNFKNAKKEDSSQASKHRRDDKDGDGGGNKKNGGGFVNNRNRQGNNDDHRGYKGGHGNGGRGRGSNNNNNEQDNCPISEHEKHYHQWGGCFLNPYSNKFNAEDAETFFQNKANGSNAWYRDVYKNALSAGGDNRSQGGGRGYGRGYQGRGGGRGYQGRNGGGGRGGYQGRGGDQGRGGNYYYDQDNYDGYYYQQPQQQPGPPAVAATQYHYGYGTAPQGPAPQGPAAPVAPPSSYAPRRY